MQPSYVGILINDKLHRRLSTGDTKYEAVDFYVEAGMKYGLTPCFFRIQDVRSGNPCIKAFIKESDRFIHKTVPMPQVIHNRAIYPGKREYDKLCSWVDSGTQLFNHWNRYGKLETHQHLMNDSTLEPHLPVTFEATEANLSIMMELYDKIIIKPDRSSIGRGVMLLQRAGDGWKLTCPASIRIHNKKWLNLEFKGTRLPSLLKKRMRKMNYIVQQHLPLATYQGKPFDMRVSVQRDGTGEWQVTGLVVKVAAPNLFLTNVAQGGSVHRLQTILTEEYAHLQHESIIDEIHSFSLKVARQLSQSLPHMADLGLDIGMTTDGSPLFIECNGKDQRYSFQEAGMLEEWRAAFYNPIAYSHYLLNTCIMTKESDP
ncbi:YheC/YheD family endospore coat-associated protein [Paenibacillus sp. UNC451MF]|uniref:YheC/YheD family endospore coat-associated protein n=1 Tax=Paenibacillus sp. UNC451MF TaxID=1449063 RepID=UPI00048C4E5C|nr:YheC/YheD family protein [Paenibacillus sp. UNC451MF]